jgi:hypothetical protein
MSTRTRCIVCANKSLAIVVNALWSVGMTASRADVKKQGSLWYARVLLTQEQRILLRSQSDITCFGDDVAAVKVV